VPAPSAARNLLDEQDDAPVSPTTVPSAGPAAPGPARPVNPELLALRAAVQAKLDASLATLAAQHQADAESLAALGADLAKGGPALADEMARLEAVRDVCLGVAARYGEVVDRAERQVAELRARGDVEVDEIVGSTTVVYNQCVRSCGGRLRRAERARRLLDLVAEDHAIEDTCYQLYSALNADPPRIDLDKFLKVRAPAHLFASKLMTAGIANASARSRAIHQAGPCQQDCACSHFSMSHGYCLTTRPQVLEMAIRPPQP
jgi:ESCRT-I complex subunit TSG101